MVDIAKSLKSGRKISIIVGAPPCGAKARPDKLDLSAVNEAVADALMEAAISEDSMSDWRCLTMPEELMARVRRRLLRMQVLGAQEGGDYRLTTRLTPGHIYFRVAVRRRLGARGPQELVSEDVMLTSEEAGHAKQ